MSRVSTRAVIAFWPWSEDDEASAGTIRSAVAGAAPQTPVLRPSTDSGGLAAWLDEVAAAHPGTDLAVIADASTLPVGWLDRLLEAAHSDDAVAVATLQVLDEPGDTGAPTIPPPRVLTPDPHCSLIRHTAFSLVGGLDAELSHPAALLADFAARAREHGLSCALVPELAAGRCDGGLRPCPVEQLERLAHRHPWLDAARGDEAALDPGPLKRVLMATRTARDGISVTVDARVLGNGVGGTQTYVGSLILALAAHPELTVRAVLAGPVDAELSGAFAAAGVTTISYEEAASGRAARTDVVHRPQQVFTPSDLRLLELLGERLVVSQMDLIGYRTPTYHASADAWRAYRRSTRMALAAADGVIFFSDHARGDALSEELVTPARATVAGIGVSAPGAELPRRRPERVPDDRELLLVLGADYAHKNRPFALRLLDELRLRHGWGGLLVLAGPHVEHGSSAAAEHELLAASPELAARVLDLGPVSDAEKRWLLERASAHLAPSNYEGFGLAPLEAAAVGRPCIYAACTSLAEIIDPAAATIVPWDVTGSAAAAARLLVPGAARERHLALLADALQRYRWEHVAAEIVAAYRDVLASPFRAAAPRAHEELQREQRLIDEHAALQDLRHRVRSGLALIDGRGPLLTPDEQRGLMRVSGRRWLRPVLGAFGWLGRLGTERRTDEGRGDASP